MPKKVKPKIPPYNQRRPKSRRPGKIVTFYLDSAQAQTWKELRNKSAFVNLALEQAAGIMAWDMLKRQAPEKYQDTNPPMEELIDDYNQLHPLDRLTQARKDKQWPKNSATSPELW